VAGALLSPILWRQTPAPSARASQAPEDPAPATSADRNAATAPAASSSRAASFDDGARDTLSAAPGRSAAFPSAALAPAAPPDAAPTPHPSDDPALYFGVTGPVSIHEIPAGPFLDSLLSLSAEDRAAALKHVGDTRIPRSQLATLRATALGGLVHICPPGPHAHHRGHNRRSADASTDASALPSSIDLTTTNAIEPAPEGAKVPISNPPALSSRPGSSKVLYLDFNGHTVSGTAWNSGPGSRPVYIALPYDTDGDPKTFSEAEQAVIREVWARVSEDFAPFDVNVTTVEPAAFTPTVSRALITLAEDANGNYVPGGEYYGGYAYVNVFGASNYHSTYAPSWIIADNVGRTSAANIAEVVSHEFGHELGLSHDGTTTATYYRGHGSGATSWAPIMGAGYGLNVTTFSKGEYLNANNPQDDLAIIAAKLSYLADDVTDTHSGAPSLGPPGTDTSGRIERNDDADRYRVTTANGRIILNVRAFTAASGTRGNNLDIRVEIFDSINADTPIAAFSPDNSPDVSIDSNFAPGTYYVRVRPTGVGDPFASPPTGYTAYGSIGAYTISNNTTAVPPPTIITQPTGAARPIGSSHTFTVVADGTATSYQWRFNGIEILGATNASYTRSNLTFADAGTYTCSVSNGSAAVVTQSAQLGVYRENPLSITINPNSNTTFPTLVAGAFNGFVWSREGTPLDPATDPRIILSGPVLRINGVRASDAGVYTLSASFNGSPINCGPVTVTVRPPVTLSVPPVVTIYRGEPPVIPITSSHNNLVYRYIGMPLGLGYNTSDASLYNGTPGPALGSYTLTLFGTDPQENRGRADFTLVVAARPIDFNIPSTLVTFGIAGILPPLPQGHANLSFRYEGIPPGFTFQSSTGRILPRTSSGATPGTYPVTVTATDPFGNSGSTTFLLEVVRLTNDRAPAFAGLVPRDPGLTQNLGGDFQLTPVRARGQPTGAYTGFMRLGGVRYALSGRLDSGGPGSDLGFALTGTARGRPNLAIALTLPVDPEQPASGTVRAGGGTPVALTLWPTRSTATAADYLGRHVLALFPPEDIDSSSAPAGIGAGTLKVAKNARATWAATLADGTRLTGAAFLGEDGRLPVFAPITKPGGSLHGPLRLSAENRSIEGEFTWLRARAPLASYAKTPVYRDGFGPLTLTVLGGPVQAPPSGTRVLGLPATSPNLRVTFAQGGLTEQHLEQLAQVPITVTAANRVTRPTAAAANPAALALALQPGASTFRGSFTLRDPNPLRPGATVTRKVAYQGVLLGERGVGYFLLPGIRTDATLTPATLSGAVFLEPLTTDE
jgi:hypothetical protein